MNNTRKIHLKLSPQGWAFEAVRELYKAKGKFPDFHSTHEGYAVLKEEVDELWDAIKANESKTRLREEATQVAAMALRFLCDCCQKEGDDESL